MSTKEIIEFLRYFNEWRRGSEEMPMPDPTEVGRVIDAACDALESNEKDRSLDWITTEELKIVRSDLASVEAERDELGFLNRSVMLVMEKVSTELAELRRDRGVIEESRRADAGWAQAARLKSALRTLIERHEEEANGGAPITGEEWEIASYALPAAKEEE